MPALLTSINIWKSWSDGKGEGGNTKLCKHQTINTRNTVDELDHAGVWHSPDHLYVAPVPVLPLQRLWNIVWHLWLALGWQLTHAKGTEGVVLTAGSSPPVTTPYIHSYKFPEILTSHNYWGMTSRNVTLVSPLMYPSSIIALSQGTMLLSPINRWC